MAQWNIVFELFFCEKKYLLVNASEEEVFIYWAYLPFSVG